VAVAAAVRQAQAVQAVAGTVQLRPLGLTVLSILAVAAAVQKVRSLELVQRVDRAS
jgi:hypothetical protein